MQKILKTLSAHGFEARCVGGCVRDSLLGRTPDDWDVATGALPEQVLTLFGDSALPTGLRHGTVTVKTEGRHVEVTTYRLDGLYRDGRHPESVTFTRSLSEDLRRRDFTVNAMALDETGVLTDPWGGRDDCNARLLRCVGNPDERFGEDALRILRCLRFASVLGFSIEQVTAGSLRRNRELLRRIAPERIRTELTKLLCGDGAAAVLRGYPEVFGVFLPELSPLFGFDQKNRHHCYDVWEHTLHSLVEVEPDPVLRYTMLLHDIGKPRCFTLDRAGAGHFYGHPKVSFELADDILRRLRFDHTTRETVLRLIEWHDRDIPRTEKGVRRVLARLGEKDLRLLLLVKRADNLAQHPDFRGMQDEIGKAEALLDGLLAKDSCVSLRQLKVNGNDLCFLGYQGPQIGAALNDLLRRVVDGELENDRDILLNELRAGVSKT